jgi:hypothetical protein
MAGTPGPPHMCIIRNDKLNIRRKEDLHIRRNEEGRKSCILEGMKKEGRAVY